MDTLSVKRRLSCILAADAVGYSRHMGRDEVGTVRVLSAHRAVIDGIIAFHEGRIVGTAGDSVLAEFSSVVEAVRCAVEIQEAIKTRNDSLPADHQLHFRVGINLGDVVVRGNDLLGDGINVAARLETMAEPGGICISSGVYDQITGKLDLGFQDIGEQNLKNISRPVRVYRVSGPRRATHANPPPGPARGPPRRLAGAVGTAGVAAAALAIAWQVGWVRIGPVESAAVPAKETRVAAPKAPMASAKPAGEPSMRPAIPAPPQDVQPAAKDGPLAKGVGIRPSPAPVSSTQAREADATAADVPRGSLEALDRTYQIDFVRSRAAERAGRSRREYGQGEALRSRQSPNDTTIIWRKRSAGSGAPDRRGP